LTDRIARAIGKVDALSMKGQTPAEKNRSRKKGASVGKKLYGLPNVRGLHGWVGFVASHAWDDALIRAHTVLVRRNCAGV
jgi:hypothetical protein